MDAEKIITKKKPTGDRNIDVGTTKNYHKRAREKHRYRAQKIGPEKKASRTGNVNLGAKKIITKKKPPGRDTSTWGKNYQAKKCLPDGKHRRRRKNSSRRKSLPDEKHQPGGKIIT